ncbi:aminotransferase class I/II-fold pyridoxal phosphate-dependent enzyme [Pyxidicoccus fallax]|uniref:Aminotransferase class I/II-fold pyridoxal phosphate-dependent enzyme n=1 Tax=Pyxidicoccus fallax TaxID=394095 RepID=A0A848LGS7_9BACT|nr:aminotransferase class I/II-fold pyridoxal phosphate-dependent enzyme [Pyxidicoccus fallax]NMO16645.1 aminotransferase class I/II-fold pyridoxal phosphate-dependent enzyme [Pyxidicoccus fallax]NPC80290.1 aminotransferase class I/II-fold pyridoxal phosphate-dependent enzyme [Pyxidicoccus fallax]
MKLATALVHAGVRRDPTTGAVAVPIYQSATFQHPALGQSTGYDYSRTRNPTRSALEDALARLEGGSRGLAFSSGMAALHCAFQLFGPEDHVLLTEDLYGGTYRLVDRLLHVPCTFVDTTRPEAVRAALRPNTRAILVESPTNPLMKTADLAAIARIAHEAGALLIVDNTFLTPWLQRPLELGADIVVHSATKYLAGHNDVVAGALVVKDAELGERLAYVQNGIGAILGPQDAYLVIRGLKTLALRMERHQANARQVAEWLGTHPLVDRVFYPGVGGMLSFTVTDAALVPGVLASVQVCLFAESLGGVETLITYPTTQTHADIPVARREQLGISDTLLRLSVGIEDCHDIIADLAQALEGARRANPSRHALAAHGS